MTVRSLPSGLAVLAILAGMPAVGCSVAPPAVLVASENGEVRAENANTARQVADMLGKLLPRVRAALPGARTELPEIWVQTELKTHTNDRANDDSGGFTVLQSDLHPVRIHLRESGDDLEWALAHELVHFLMGPEWSTLPGALAEGLADHLAMEVLPLEVVRIRTNRLLLASLWVRGVPFRLVSTVPLEAGGPSDVLRIEGRFRFQSQRPAPDMTVRELLGLGLWDLNRRKDRDDFPSYHGLGFLVAEELFDRIGVDGLLELCRQAKREGHEVVPVGWIVAAAELPEDLGPVLESRIGPGELAELARWHAQLVVEALLHFHPPPARGGDAGTYLDEAKPQLRLGEHASVELAEIPEIRAALRRSLPDFRDADRAAVLEVPSRPAGVTE
ncbi:MAG TPA: hypothetical protein VGC54_07735 [Planctomycetota bacterium]